MKQIIRCYVKYISWYKIMHFHGGLSKLMWHAHFVSNVVSTSVLMCPLYVSRLTQEFFSLHLSCPHYVWWLKMNIAVMGLMTERLWPPQFLLLILWQPKFAFCDTLDTLVMVATYPKAKRVQETIVTLQSPSYKNPFVEYAICHIAKSYPRVEQNCELEDTSRTIF